MNKVTDEMTPLYIVFGGEMKDCASSTFVNEQDIDIKGFYSDRDTAYSVWKGASQQSVDNAMMRYFLVELTDKLT